MKHPDIKPYRVLIVDDSEYIRKLVTILLDSQPDFEVVATANDGRECLNLVEEISPDLITLDWSMPGMDGFETLQRLKGITEAPVVVVSSLPVDESPLVEQLEELGAAGAVCKPFGESAAGIGPFEGRLIAELRRVALVVRMEKS